MAENNKTNFVRQGSILAAASIFVRLIGIVYRIPMSNIIGDVGNGIYSAAFEVYSLALILSSYSIPLAVSKLLSVKLTNKEYKASMKIFRSALVFALISGGIMALLVFFGANFIEKTFYAKFPGIAIPLRILAITIFVVAILGTFRGFFQARKTMIPTAVSQIIEQILNAFASIFFCWYFMKQNAASLFVAGWGAAGGTMGTLIGAVAGLLFVLFIYVIYKPTVNKQIRHDHSASVEDYGTIYKMLFATIIPVVLSQAVYQASGVIDNMMYSALGKGDAIAATYGIYSTRYKLLVNVPIAVSSAMASSMIPTIVSYFSKRELDAVRNRLAVSVKFNMIIAFPCAVGLAVLGTPILRLLFRNTNYVLGGKLMWAGASAVIFYALSTVTNAALQGIDLMRKPVTHSAISLAVHVIMLLVLLKFTDLGVYALVVGNVTFPLLVCILNASTLSIELEYKQEWISSFLIPAAASVIMGALALGIYKLIFFLLPVNTIACLTAIALAVPVYFACIFLMGGLKSEDLPDFPMGMRIGRIARKLHLMK